MGFEKLFRAESKTFLLANKYAGNYLSLIPPLIKQSQTTKRKFNQFLLTVSILCCGFTVGASGTKTSDNENTDWLLHFIQNSVLHYYYIYFRYPSVEDLIEYHQAQFKEALKEMHPQEVKKGNIGKTLTFLKKEKKQIRLVPDGNTLLFYYRDGIWEYDMDYCKDKNRYWDTKSVQHLFSTFTKKGTYIHEKYETEWFAIQTRLREKYPIVTPYITDGDTIVYHLFHYDRKKGLTFICPTDIEVKNNSYVKDLICALDTFMNNRKQIESIHFLTTLQEAENDEEKQAIIQSGISSGLKHYYWMLWILSLFYKRFHRLL